MEIGKYKITSMITLMPMTSKMIILELVMAMRPVETFFVSIYVKSHINGVDGTLTAINFWEEPAAGFVVGIPILSKDIKIIFLKERKAIRMFFGTGDMDPHILAADIFITKTAHLSDDKAG